MATALIIHPHLTSRPREDAQDFSFTLDEQVEEAKGLAHAIFLDVVGLKVARVARPSPGHFLGKGTRAEIAALCDAEKPSVVIVNHALSPVQQRNLEKEWNAKVIDRTGLILEIFGARAQTSEGKIQVELAALEYQKSRLVRSWTHLERQRGGLGKTGGPGETQIELDRRLIADRISALKKQLEQVRRSRELQRRSRERVPFPVVALVGYTNAGKSTLFNRLTGAEVFAKDLLFATLDPTMRRVKLDNGQEVILSDTVGFIADLPTGLVAAFRATLEQVAFADVIVHVRDVARPGHEAQKQEVVKTLAGLGVDYGEDERVVEVWNKIDLLPEDGRADILRQASFQENAVPLSAVTGEGIPAFLNKIREIVSRRRQTVLYRIGIADGEALAWLHRNAHIMKQNSAEETIELETEIDPADIGRFRERFRYEPVKRRRHEA